MITRKQPHENSAISSARPLLALPHDGAVELAAEHKEQRDPIRG
jgi:hypothetical protein